ncbi:Asp-tRNA(Asn)/Glu-tRNA(Gln) amidotransferase subunit GatB [bacterium]|nr:Asp-tRNA(Asn)/Glu-tRNA(Gln) amidotransferase subunit GatB [bacterium]
MKFETVIGLEVHAQLSTLSKMFCGCSIRFGAAPNSQTCPVCLGMPGVLPVTNRTAVEYAVRMGLAVHCDIQPHSVFARKNYFYPDLPKGYQISQYEEPICLGGWIDVEPEPGEKRKIRIHRIHLEEDAGKSVHDEAYISGNETLIDLNRCGTPLIEIVSEPDIRSPKEAYLYLHKIRQMVRWLGICDGNMEEGSLRCDANISLRPVGTTDLGVKTELKNMNSMRGVEKALTFEVKRQTEILSEGGAVIQQTLLWDEAAGKAVPMRGKEEAHDYRYFPDPDLTPLIVEEAWVREVGESLPELPDDRKNRWTADYGLSDYDASVLNEDRGISDYFEDVVRETDNPKTAANWIMGEVLRRLNEEKTGIENLKVRPGDISHLIRLVNEGTVSHSAAKTVFDHIAETGDTPDKAVEKLGLKQVSNASELGDLVQKVIDDNPDALKKYLGGKDALFGFFVGQAMQASRGKANPKVVQDLLREKLNALRQSES